MKIPIQSSLQPEPARAAIHELPLHIATKAFSTDVCKKLNCYYFSNPYVHARMLPSIYFTLLNPAFFKMR